MEIKKLFSTLNIVFVFSVLAVFLIGVGFLPRETIFPVLGVIVLFIIFWPLEDSASLFVRMIPLFIALPISDSFDNFNSWRIVSAVIFIKWLFEKWRARPSRLWRDDGGRAKEWDFSELSSLIKTRDFKKIWQKHKISVLCVFLFLLAILSLSQAVFLTQGIKRIIYFANLILFPIVLSDLISKNKDYFSQTAKNALVGAGIAFLAGFAQLISVYVLPFFDFMGLWGERMQWNFFGRQWAEIAMSANTWFAYNMSESLRLRVFSIFPDSHTFPLYLLLAMPFLAYFALGDIFKKKKVIFWIVILFAIFLIIILSGTRGIWASIVFPLAFCAWQFFATQKNTEKRKIVLAGFSVFGIFIASFAAAYLILQQPQFRVDESAGAEKADIIKRVSSIIDAGETSNAGRLEIWKKTLISMAKKPFLGVGIGNFPIVLDEKIETAKAGASAHNLYLNVGAEMGILAMGLFLLLFWEFLANAYSLFQKSEDEKIRYFGFSAVFFLLWAYGYNLTDAALNDERAFLIFGGLVAVIVGLNSKSKSQNAKVQSKI